MPRPVEARLSAGGEAWHWSIHPHATRPDLAPRFVPPPVWMCGAE